MKNTENARAEKSLRDKLKQIGNPKENETLTVSLTKDEAELYSIFENDVMGKQEIIMESEGIDE